MRERDALLIHDAAIGDFLICVRVLELWTGVEPPYRWWYLGKASLGRLGKSLGILSGYTDVHTGPWHRLFGADHGVPDDVAAFFRRFSLTVNALAGAEEPVSRNLTKLAPGEIVHVDPRLPSNFDGHCWEYLVRQIDRRCALPLPTRFYRPAESDLQAARRLVKEKRIDPARLVLIHPGASGRSKRWPMKNFLQLADALQSLGWTAGFLLGPVEREQFSEEQIATLHQTGPVWSNVKLHELAGLLHRARAYVGNDNGISHLAAMVGALTVVLFVSTNPLHYRPLGPRVNVVNAASSAPDPAAMETILGILQGDPSVTKEGTAQCPTASSRQQRRPDGR